VAETGDALAQAEKDWKEKVAALLSSGLSKREPTTTTTTDNSASLSMTKVSSVALVPNDYCHQWSITFGMADCTSSVDYTASLSSLLFSSRQNSRFLTRDVVTPRTWRRWKTHVMFELPKSHSSTRAASPSPSTDLVVPNLLSPAWLVYIHNIYKAQYLSPSASSVQQLSNAFSRQEMVTSEGYKDYCWITSSGKCLPAESLMPFFFRQTPNDNSTVFDIDGGIGDYLTGDFKSVRIVPSGLFFFFFFQLNLRFSRQALSVVLKNQVFFYTDETFSSENPTSRLFRIQLNWGYPVPPYSNPEADVGAQSVVLRDFLSTFSTKYLKAHQNERTDIALFYGGDLLTEYEIQQTIFKDASFAVASLCLVFLLMWIHMESLFLSLCALLQIFLSFPMCANTQFLIVYFLS